MTQENVAASSTTSGVKVAAPVFAHIYSGKFKDRASSVRPAGILTYEQGESVQRSLRTNINSVSSKAAVEASLAKFGQYRSPEVGEVRLHYGHAADSRHYEQLTHGVRSDEKSFKAQDCINPAPLSRFDFVKHELSESTYMSKRIAPLGKVPRGHLPPEIDPAVFAFGLTSAKCDTVKDCVRPDKSRQAVESEISGATHALYVRSHQDYEPGEQKRRQFEAPAFKREQRFGVSTQVAHDGRAAKSSLNWLPQTVMDKYAHSDATLLDKFREQHTSQLGQPLDPNRSTRFLSADHAFGFSDHSGIYSSGDVMHSRPDERLCKGRERQSAFVAALRTNLARYNLVSFKTLVDAFKFYDKNKDGLVCQDELKAACAAAGVAAADELLSLLIRELDKDNDGKLNFLEFVNFLCYKDSMKVGIDCNSYRNQPNPVDIRDDEGRLLLSSSDLVPKNNIAVNDLVPRVLNNQIDFKWGSWKTSYDIINDAATRAEPLKKRVYGVPSIRNDIVAPDFKKIQDKTNYGNDGNAWSLLSPSVFAQHGVYENDVLKPRTKPELRAIFQSVGYCIGDELFEQTHQAAQALNPYGEVSVEEFRSALDQQQAQAQTNIFQDKSQISV